MKYSKEDIIRLVDEEDVEFIRLQFCDLSGMLKNVALTSSQIERALDGRCMFDGSSIEGYVRIEESDMYLHPDLDSFAIFPWRPQQGKVARLMCDIYRPDGVPFEGDPRGVLRKAIKKAKDMGFIFDVGPECEFFLFDTDEDGLPTISSHDMAGYFDVSPIDQAENVRRDIILSLEDMGISVEASHHELAAAQHEIDLGHEEALSSADNILLFRMTVKTIAKRHGLHATFMPKPHDGIHGSGLHINMSLLDEDGRNLFCDESDKDCLSLIAHQFMAGILAHMREMALLTNPLVNSYKRLVPGYEAPVYLAWSAAPNRSPMIRIPSERGENTRIELRSPDAAANPYLAYAACLAAGLDGIEKGMTPPESVDENMYEMSQEELDERHVGLLPETLGEALDEFKKSDFMKDLLGEHIFYKYCEAKEKEWNDFRTVVTDWERREYMYRY